MKKKLSALALISASALVLAGCSGTGAGTPTESATATETSAPAEAGNVTVWLVGTDTPDTARQYLKNTFETENEGWTLTIEEKTWADVSDTYTASLSGNSAPDVVETGNTQALGFADQGLFLNIDDVAAEVGIDNLLGGLVDAGTYEGSLYAAPYYAGGRVVFYTPEIVGDTLPTTLEEYVAKGIELTEGARSGIYLPGQDWYNALPFVWAYGGEIAVQDGDTWDAQFSSDASLKGLELLQKVYTSGTKAPVDGDERVGNIAFCEGNVGFLSSPAWAEGNLTGAWPWGDAAAGQEVSEGCPETFAKELAAFALPGATAGETAPIFAGGSNIAVATKSQNPDQAKAALKIILSEGYQTLLAEQGLTPGLLSAASALPDTAIATAQAQGLANSKFTPTSPNWGEVEATGVIKEALINIAKGGDLKEITTKLDEQIEAILNK